MQVWLKSVLPIRTLFSQPITPISLRRQKKGYRKVFCVDQYKRVSCVQNSTHSLD